MCRCLSLTVLCVLMVQDTGAAQPWRDALTQGDFASARRQLESLVLDPAEMFPPANEAEQLAMLYLEGRGGPQDRILACSLLDLAARSARRRSYLDQRDARIERRRDDACQPLSEEERREAGRLMGCVTFGPERQSFALDAGHWAEISRSGIRLHYNDADTLHELPGIACGHEVLPIRHTRVDAFEPRGPRHFLEVSSSVWRGGRPHTWRLVEVVGGTVRLRAVEMLRGSPDLSQHSVVPAVTFRARADGTVTWRFEDGRLSGAIEGLEAQLEPPDDLPAIEPGTGRVDVTVRDRFGAPMPGVTVTLTGVRAATLQTAETGAVSFVDVPDGRYDVVASLKGFPSSLPRVIDLAGLVTPVEIVLKPSAAIGWHMNAFGGSPSTLELLAADADAIAHVKVTRQRSYRREARDESDHAFIMTASTVEWIESFKSSSRVTAGDEIVQGGGRLEKPDEIEIATSNRSAPLNVGDEYVLYVKRYDELGYVVIHYAENGAFLIRNGRVQALGEHALAKTWKDRSAAKFFEALRTSLKARSTR